MAKLEESLPLSLVPDSNHRLLRTPRTKVYIQNIAFKFYCLLSALVLGAVLLSLLIFIGKTGILVFKDVSPLEFFFSTRWEPDMEKFGAAIFILGTFALTGLTLLIAVPLALLLAVFIVEGAPPWLAKSIRPLLDLLVGIPSIVYGYLGITLLVPLIMDVTGSPMGDGLLAAALVLSLMVLPTISSISIDALSSVPRELREGSYALGSTRFQAVTRVILPAAKPGIFTAAILGMARAIGETMAVVMVIGNTAQLPETLTTSTSVLTSNIVMQIIDVPFDSTWNNALYMMAFLLLIISNIMIMVVRKIRGKRA